MYLQLCCLQLHVLACNTLNFVWQWHKHCVNLHLCWPSVAPPPLQQQAETAAGGVEALEVGCATRMAQDTTNTTRLPSTNSTSTALPCTEQNSRLHS